MEPYREQEPYEELEMEVFLFSEDGIRTDNIDISNPDNGEWM